MIEEPDASLPISVASLLGNPNVQFISGTSHVRGIKHIEPTTKMVTVNKNVYYRRIVADENATETIHMPNIFAWDCETGKRVWG